MKKSTKEIRRVAKLIQQKLLNAGVTIQYYEATSSNSIYMKFDCGLCNSLRIGDHNGYEHLNYMFKVDVNHDGYRKVEFGKFTQYTYAPTKKQINKLVRHILAHRERRILQYQGEENYKQIMNEQYQQNKNTHGFWSNSHFVEKEGQLCF